ncbi:MAG: hypothetical protein AAGI30_08305 [Planctomycetota bacterium]
MTTNASSSQPPAARLRRGNISASIWRNETRDGDPIYNVKFERSYKDAQGDYQNIDSYGVSDLLLLAKVADLAHDEISRRLDEERERAKAARAKPSGKSERGR